MTLGNRLRAERKRAGLTQKQLADKIGAKHNSVSNWENGLNMPDPFMIESICCVLSITPNDLLMSDNSKVVNDNIFFNTAEKELINRYRILDDKSRGAINALVDYYYCAVSADISDLASIAPMIDAAAMRDRNSTYCKPEFEVINGLISTQSVAAGTGTYLDYDLFDTISIRKNDLTKRAKFYVPVSGDSMEPKFSDGDILIIENSSVNIGEIGVFTLNGSGFVKVRGRSELISLNPEYSPIPMDDDIICNGKVIGVLNPEWLIRQPVTE